MAWTLNSMPDRKRGPPEWAFRRCWHFAPLGTGARDFKIMG